MTTQEKDNTTVHQTKESFFTKMQWCGPDQHGRPMGCSRRWWPIRILVTLFVLGIVFSIGRHVWMMHGMGMTEYNSRNPMVRHHMQKSETANTESTTTTTSAQPQTTTTTQ